MRILAAVFAGAVIVLSSGAAAQPPPSCEQERAELRWLVQQYALARTTLEFQLARSEARRHAMEAEVDRLRPADKSAPRQIPGGPQ